MKSIQLKKGKFLLEEKAPSTLEKKPKKRLIKRHPAHDPAACIIYREFSKRRGFKSRPWLALLPPPVGCLGASSYPGYRAAQSQSAEYSRPGCTPGGGGRVHPPPGSSPGFALTGSTLTGHAAQTRNHNQPRIDLRRSSPGSVSWRMELSGPLGIQVIKSKGNRGCRDLLISCVLLLIFRIILVTRQMIRVTRPQPAANWSAPACSRNMALLSETSISRDADLR